MIPGLCVVQCLVSCVVICRLLLVLFLAIVLLYVLLNTHLVCSHTHQWFKHVGQRNSTSITRNDIICIKLQKSTTWEHHHFTKRKIWAYKTISTPPLLWSTCAKPWKWAVMYMCVSGIDFSSFYEFLLDFGTVPTAWYFLFFMLLLLVAYWHYIIIIGGILKLYYYYWWHIDIVLLLLVAHWHCIIIIGGILTLYYYYWWHTDIVLLLLVAYWHCILLCIGDVCQHNIV